ncbi:hypothetical protein V6615_15575 [Oscillospiraceae bacterium PP1C4]
MPPQVTIFIPMGASSLTSVMIFAGGIKTIAKIIQLLEMIFSADLSKVNGAVFKPLTGMILSDTIGMNKNVFIP